MLEAGALSVRLGISHSVDNLGPLDKILGRDPQGRRAPAPQGRAEAPDRRDQDCSSTAGCSPAAPSCASPGESARSTRSTIRTIRASCSSPETGSCRWSATAVESGLQFTAHSVGDGAVHALLDAYEEVNKQTPVAPTRPCHHAFELHEPRGDRPGRAARGRGRHPAGLALPRRAGPSLAQFGYDRLRYFQPLRSLFAAGVIAGGGSDHMQKIGSFRSINPYNPFLGMAIAITRRAKGLRPAAPPRGGPDPRAGHPVLHDQQRPPAVPRRPDRLARSRQAGGLRRDRPGSAPLPGRPDHDDPGPVPPTSTASGSSSVGSERRSVNG